MDTNKETSSSYDVCKGCGWQCPINALSCNRGRKLNGVPEVETAKPGRPSGSTKAERFLRRLNRRNSVVNDSEDKQ